MENTSVFIQYYNIKTDACQAENKHVKKRLAGKLWEKVGTEERISNKRNYFSMLSLS